MRGRRALAFAGARPTTATTAPQRAVTLIELLIVLALLVAIAALALPTTLETVARRQFESNVDSLLGQLRLARNHARSTASAVEVVVAPDGDGAIRVTATTVDVRDLVHDSLDALADDQDAALRADAPDDGDASKSFGAIEASWADARYELSLSDAGDDSASSTSDTAGDPSGSGATGQRTTKDATGGSRPGPTPARRRIALFVADGGAPIAARLVVRDADGRSATIAVNPWTGLASIGPPVSTATLAEVSADGLDLPDAPPEEASP